MIGIVVELIISWLLLWFFAKKNIAVLGFSPTKNRIKNLVIGFLLAFITCTLYHLMTVAFVDNGWTLSKQVSFQTLLLGIWWTLKSVLFEELIFRGALLYVAIQKIGPKIACVLSATCFGVYHWFSYGTFGNPFQMTILFLMTGIFGFALAFGFAKTSSLYLPVGLHLGWNISNIVIFSNGPLGQQFFVKANANQLQGVTSLFVFLFQVLALPLLALLYIKWFVKDDSSFRITNAQRSLK